MNTKTIRKMALAAALLLLPLSMSGQEMVRYIADVTTDFTLARMTSPYKEWVAYNENAGMSLFALMDTSSVPNTFVRTQQQIHVKDMEIGGGKLYFCGSMFSYDLMEDIGVMGYFTIADFSDPSTMEVYYMPFPEFKELRKMIYYSSPQTLHVAMVGTGKDDVDYVADAYYTNGISGVPGTWNRRWFDIPNIDAKFDDIASHKDSIVVSARIEKETEVQMCFIGKTSLEGAPFFATSGVDMLKIPDAPMSRVLLQKASDGVYAFYRYGPYLDVCQLKLRKNTQSFHIPILATGGYLGESFTLKDVCVDVKSLDEISVLLTKVDKDIIFSHRIYHLPISLFPAGGGLSAHEYYYLGGYTPMSLCGGKDYLTTTMGRFTEHWGMARVNNHRFEGGCTERLNVETRIKRLGWVRSDKEKRVYTGPAEMLTMPVTELDYTVITHCSDYIGDYKVETDKN